VSNPAILSLAPVAASLAIFDEVGLPALRAKSIVLTGYFEALVDELVPDAVILTPRDPDARGAQLSLRLTEAPRRLDALGAAGVVGDFREPDILRLAPVPLYNTYRDAWAAARALAATA
jgi:kynureninase